MYYCGLVVDIIIYAMRLYMWFVDIVLYMIHYYAICVWSSNISLTIIVI